MKFSTNFTKVAMSNCEQKGAVHDDQDSLDEEILASGRVCCDCGDSAHHPWKEEGG
jgi:hypothetical protein